MIQLLHFRESTVRNADPWFSVRMDSILPGSTVPSKSDYFFDAHSFEIIDYVY